MIKAEISKNKGEGLKGYGYRLSIEKEGKRINVYGSFPSVSMAESGLSKFLYREAEEIGLVELIKNGLQLTIKAEI